MEKYLNTLKDIFMAGVERADPYKMMLRHLSLEDSILKIRTGQENRNRFYTDINLSDFSKLHVIGTGKATAKMAKAIEDIMGDRITQGVISVKYGHVEDLRQIRIIEAGHPVPDENSIKAALEISELSRKSDEKTLVITLISGGGSALMAYPFSTRFQAGYQGQEIILSFKDKQETTRVLLECGAAINEINCVRKHLSGIKGGRLAKMIFPAASLNFILSDVVGDRLDCIASGPTTPDNSTFHDMLEIINKYDISGKLPENVKKILDSGLDRTVEDTPKQGDSAFKRVNNILIGTNYQSLQAAEKKAESLGFNTVILSSQVIGEAREAAKLLCGIAKDAGKRELLGKKPLCIIAGGETTVTLRGSGKGGRNQEMALSFLSEIENDPEGTQGIYFLSASTDGNDGPTDAAGAFASNEILDSANTKNLSVNEYLKNNDSYNFFDKAGFLLKTGPTNTNVCDLQLMLISK
ncbi:MAG: glycerate kinase [Desulfobacteraceae bacterium]|nr:glycerate kinase [Desulfobacteraceae bacterium]